MSIPENIHFVEKNESIEFTHVENPTPIAIFAILKACSDAQPSPGCGSRAIDFPAFRQRLE